MKTKLTIILLIFAGFLSAEVLRVNFESRPAVGGQWKTLLNLETERPQDIYLKISIQSNNIVILGSPDWFALTNR